MPSLSEIQASMSRALLAGDAATRALPPTWFVGDATDGLRVHRNTVIGGCCQALRLSFPTLERVLGSALFDALAAEFARAYPPEVAVLGQYGEDFPGFVRSHSAPQDQPLLLELAQFDWLFERVAQCVPDEFAVAPALVLDGGVQLQLATSLRLFTAGYAVDEWRAAAADVRPLATPRTLALWRRENGVAVQALSPVAANWLALLVAGDAAAAIAGIAADDTAPEIIDTIANEIFRASFVRLSIDHETKRNLP